MGNKEIADKNLVRVVCVGICEPGLRVAWQGNCNSYQQLQLYKFPSACDWVQS
jgi:hypothetical protein